MEDLAEYVLHLDKWVIQGYIVQEQVKANKVEVQKSVAVTSVVSDFDSVVKYFYTLRQKVGVGSRVYKMIMTVVVIACNVGFFSHLNHCHYGCADIDPSYSIHG